MNKEVFIFPTSFAQQRLWFLDQFAPGNPVYNIPLAFRLTGPLNAGLLEQSLNEIIRRHEVLRTSFTVIDEQPVQVIAPALTLQLSIVDLQRQPEAERETEVNRLITQEARSPFDLSRAPLLRFTLFRLDPEEYILLLIMHHIISDGWSIGVLFRELSILYQAFSIGKSSPLPPLPIQYADFAVWQREWLQREVLESQLTYWKHQLKDVPPLLELPTDRPRPAIQTYRGAVQRFRFPSSLSKALGTLSRREGTTLFMTLLAAFQTLLYRYTRQEDIVVGTPIAGRTRSELEDLIGFFVNTLVLRTKLSDNPPFRELLSRVRTIALEAYEHQDLPFEKLVEELQPERNLSYSPLFQTMFILQNTPPQVLELPNLTVSPVEINTELAKFDLTLSMMEQERELSGTFQYNTDLFDASTISRIAGHFQRLLESIVSNPDQPVSGLPFWTEDEQDQIIRAWNNTSTNYPEDRCIHQLFEAQVEQTPEAPAVLFEDKQWTYRELNRQANQLAHHLRIRGIGPGKLVGIYVHRSVELIVGLLGVLKAGGAYVPLDPAYPAERLTYMLEDTGVCLLLTQEGLLTYLPSYSGPVVCLDRDRCLFAQEDDTNPPLLTTPEDLAYVIYTSGSTGRPKGVLNHHRGVVNYLTFLADTYHLSSDDSILQLAPFSFDASVRDLIGPLTIGARVLLVNHRDAQDPTALLTQMKRHQATCLLSVVPTMLDRLIETAQAQEFSYEALRLILVSGEALSLATWRKAQAVFSSCQIVNQYGPTECTMTSTYYPILLPDPLRDPLLIGRPIPNAQVYILDKHLQPVPIGVTGELHIGGVGLAWGYWNRPDITAEKFVPHPFSQEPGARLYKTGDLARYLPDGNIEFLGRVDHQIKLRGVRIELGEIEAMLAQHPAVHKAIVLAREEKPGEKHLVAYIIPNSRQVPSISALRIFLQQKLPAYMLPSAFVFLETFPLTPNGKIDRRALPEPAVTHSELEKAFVLPRNSIEKELTEIWVQVLGLNQIGVYDNFFALGGHSLLATQIMSRVHHIFQVDLPLRALFETPTIAGLAWRITQNLRKKAESKDLNSLLQDLESLSDQEAESVLEQLKGKGL